MRIPFAAALGALLFFSAAPASALSQPNGTPIPTEPGCSGGTTPNGLLAAFACACTSPGVCNIGVPCTSQTSCDDGKHGTCESTMWHAFNDNTCIPTLKSGLDPPVEAATTPETFHPTCALTFTVLTRGTALFKDAFGWYNVTGAKPDPSDLHPMLACTAGPAAAVVLNLTKEPAYKGGDIGFFLLTPESHSSPKTCSNGDCCGTVPRLQNGEGYAYYSERKFNPDQSGASSFIHLLTFNSHLTKQKFYFAWEDILGGSNNDFTDLVTSVEGVECSGGGVACNTGKSGICANGITTCSNGTISCAPVLASQPEACNGVDDDCNGQTDDGATCPTAGDVCQNGRCVHACGSAEFPCASGTVCDDKTRYCVLPSCVGVTCPSGQICRAGKCAVPCAGVTCPYGQSCVGDQCLNLCAGKTCPGGQICHEGACFSGCAQCDGIACAAGSKCDTASGECTNPSCTAPCAAGTHCKAGACVDACNGAVCPEGQTCSGGQCHLIGVDVDGGLGGLGGPGGDADADGGSGGGGNGEGDFGTSRGGCSCDAASGTGYGEGALAALVVGVIAAWRRRRRRLMSSDA